MKKFVSVILVCAMLICCMFVLASCGKTLNGTYKGSVVGLATFEFKGSKYTYALGNASVTGKYEIKKEDDKMTITLTPDSDKDADEKASGTFSFEEGKDSKGNYIVIGGYTYYKQ